MIEFYCSTTEDTEEVGRKIGSTLAEGDVVCLSGDLGAGKTVLSRGIARSAGVPDEEVSSPTFAIMNVYAGAKAEVRHFDLFRIDKAEELEDIGFDEYVGGYGITIIEWADLFTEALPEEYLHVQIMVEGSGRRIRLEAYGKYYEETVKRVTEIVDPRD